MAVIFEYGSDAYLIAVDGAGALLGADDVIAKVTGYTGELSLNDFYRLAGSDLPWQ